MRNQLCELVIYDLMVNLMVSKGLLKSYGDIGNVGGWEIVLERSCYV